MAFPIAALVTILANCLPSHGQASGWTVMLYANGRTDLECSALRNIQEIAAIGSSREVNFLVELGRPSNSNGCPGFPMWHGVRRFRVTRDIRLTARSSGPPTQTAEDMGSVEHLADFVRWSMTRYPARHYMLVIWGHREAADPETGNALLDCAVRDHLQRVLGDRKLDILGYDACLKATIESVSSLSAVARFFIGSEENEPGSGWNYLAWPRQLSKSPSMSAEELARAIVASYGKKYPGSDSRWNAVTLSAIRLAAVPELASRLSRFSVDAAAQMSPRLAECITVARKRCPSYGTPAIRDQIDLLRFMTELSKTAGVADSLRADIESVMNYFRESVILANHRSALGAESVGSFGLSIYFPDLDSISHAPIRRSGDTGYCSTGGSAAEDYTWYEHWVHFLTIYVAMLARNHVDARQTISHPGSSA